MRTEVGGREYVSPTETSGTRRETRAICKELTGYGSWIDKDEGPLFAADVNVVARKKTLGDETFGMRSKTEGTAIWTGYWRSVGICLESRKEPLCVEDRDAVPAAVHENGLASAQTGNILFALEVRPQWSGSKTVYISHDPADGGHDQ